MEANYSSGNLIPDGGSYMGTHLRRPVWMDQQPDAFHQQHQFNSRQGSLFFPPNHDSLPLIIGSIQQYNQTIPLADYNKGKKGKAFFSDEDEQNFVEDTVVKGLNREKESPWHRVKWSDKMVRLLITAVSYIGDECLAEYGSMRRQNINLQKKGKWKTVSKVMAERGHFVSPQQCEDKFNDLNKRYKRLNEILGRGTSCDVVEKPALLDSMDHIPDKAKEEVRKILSSKHLYYEEMCSYHNRNQLHLPADPELQRSLHLALGSGNDHDQNDTKRNPQYVLNDEDHDAEKDGNNEIEENLALHGNHIGTNGSRGASAKRMKDCLGHGDIGFDNSLNYLDCNKAFNSQPQNVHDNVNQTSPESLKDNLLQNQWMKHRSLLLEEQKLQIRAQMLKLEKEQFKWQRFCKKRDRLLEIMRMQNGRIKLENECIALELKRNDMRC